MKSTLVTLLFVLVIMTAASCGQEIPFPAGINGNKIVKNAELMSDTLVIKIGSNEFIANLLDNPTANVFKAMLPLTMNMTELNDNEKYFDLPKSLPTSPSNAGKINTGDLCLYGSKTLVLFYESFSTSYRYTRLGKIGDTSGLEEALGDGDIVVIIELK